mmetsp:Transcript_17497/g.25538  ORF Transcript_17497/g.25538 Transcript_17497/m.25538 type:complete len:226 (+) Transcript_17497:303-980(+)|eukprot:CAMPEP_0197261488 /NCGR_PEP_ID=MMETSP1429-20130617/84572_1 /TAXON_ID=49237 /ORGANISM="Chaetoceros  sp., Strain UNC1202" /LENGTH=225 /DNA_ID=CAMNT_0042725757 /DNA_START=298 /DNA_END=975 /DNA_ORIENTATION=-
MSLVNVSNIAVLDNPAEFGNPLQFEITFECLQQLDEDLEWKVVYVGSAKSSTHDQILDEILVGPVPVGINKFILQADPPNASSIPENDILGVTVILVTCSYREKEFLRVGYYVNNEYTEEYNEETGPPKPLDFKKVCRTILADKPRVTRFPINWGDPGNEAEEQEQEQAQMRENGTTENMLEDDNPEDAIESMEDEEEDDDDEVEEDEEEIAIEVDNNSTMVTCE